MKLLNFILALVVSVLMVTSPVDANDGKPSASNFSPTATTICYTENTLTNCTSQRTARAVKKSSTIASRSVDNLIHTRDNYLLNLPRFCR